MKTKEEVEAKLVELDGAWKSAKVAFDAMLVMPRGPEREKAFNEACSNHSGDWIEVECEADALRDVVSIWKATEEVLVDAWSEKNERPDLAKLRSDPKIVAVVREEIVRCSRLWQYWQGLFGTESLCRIRRFAWVLEVEPCYDYLDEDDLTDREKAMLEDQTDAIIAPIAAAIKKLES